MIDLSGKYVRTESNAESGRLLKMAIAQGYKTPVGEKVLEDSRVFHFVGSPYKSIYTPENISIFDSDKIIRYGDLCGDEREELSKIVDSAMRWCRAFGYSHVAIYANDEENEFTGQGLANSEDGMRQNVEGKLRKPAKVSLNDIEKMLGYPIEIIP